MPRSTKKRKPNPEPESESTSSSSDSDEQESLPQENIQIDLEARSPTESDQSAVVQFLEQSFGNSIKKSVLDLYQLATQLVNQKSCGSVFYQPLDDEDEDEEEDDESLVLGISSFLQFDQQENKQLKKWFAEKCSENSQAKNILQDSKCGLFVNERYMNIPADVSLPSIRSLREEIQTPIDFWIVHAKLRSPKSDPSTIDYLNAEEEIFDENSTVSIEYQPNQSNANDCIEKRRILFISTNKLDKICSDIEQKLK